MPDRDEVRSMVPQIDAKMRDGAWQINKRSNGPFPQKTNHGLIQLRVP